MSRVMRAFTLDQSTSDAINTLAAEKRTERRILLLLPALLEQPGMPEPIDGNSLAPTDYIKFFEALGQPKDVGPGTERPKPISWAAKLKIYQAEKPPWARLQAALLLAYKKQPETAHRIELAIREAQKLNRRSHRKWATFSARPPGKRAGLVPASRIADALIVRGLKALDDEAAAVDRQKTFGVSLGVGEAVFAKKRASVVSLDKRAAVSPIAAPKSPAKPPAKSPTKPHEKAATAHELTVSKTGHDGQSEAQRTGTPGNSEAQA